MLKPRVSYFQEYKVVIQLLLNCVHHVNHSTYFNSIFEKKNEITEPRLSTPPPQKRSRMPF